ncbi:HlyD family efflux transporter periplasmic adaptor subunit [Acetobacter sicerae]|uniref:HlyD family efflux transporter periplasmic adaptor subunit n=1 Tax=Acetobacter sicerae TaxID=85325 RepID=A0ABS8VUV1_9PROT|nr:HlyD family efflux transporter periplasmic adaptor subunit [Acetobacter sicerae]MCE0742332.1 HlyD family efflux transporter periplasmic adaptor subunit [Acetobacter sicerae]NHN92343.1 HlyD family efflux transporter periplasmic adaptor subunit [Acetobacter sicerae]
MSSLYRQEALDARRQAWLGQVQATQSLSIRVISWVTLALVFLAVLYVCFGIYTRRVHATGYMLPPTGLITIDASAAGIISARLAEEGQHVHKGQKLFTIDLEARSSTGPTQEQVLGQLRRQRELLEQQKEIRIADAPVEKQALINQIRNLQQQHNLTGMQLSNDAKVLPVVEAAVNRMKNAQSAHLVTETQFQSQLYTYAQLLSSHAQFMQTYTDTEGKISDNTSKLMRYDRQTAHDINDLDRQISDIDKQIDESESHRTIIIEAPDDGILSAVRGNLGQQVSAGTPLVTLLPTGRSLDAELYVSSASIGFLREGEPVLMHYAAFPYQRFGLARGRVVEITRAPITESQPGQGQQSASGSKDKKDSGNGSGGSDLYRIRVKPDLPYIVAYGDKKPLEAGMEVEADIAIDSRRLYQWIFDPVISMRHSIDAISGGLVDK